MRVLIAVDSFKGSLSSKDAGQAIKNGFLNVDSSTVADIFPIADGGEGTVDALANGLCGEIINISVHGPLGDSVIAKYCIINKTTAVIEMAQAAGLTQVPKNLRNPMNTTTFGVGELIYDAISRGCRSFIIGIGGSATNDGGVGMLSALGFEFLDKNGEKIPKGAKGLELLHSISTKNVLKDLNNCSFRIACDVKNPLCGENGCSAVFAPQKGANADDIKKMDLWLSNYANIAKSIFPLSDMNYEGAGAAGGLGFAFMTFLGAKLESGIDIILDEINLEEHIKSADLVITGEGRLDKQSVMGKAPIGVAKLAKKHNKKVVALAGCIENGASICNDFGIDAFFPIIQAPISLDEAMDENIAKSNLEKTAEQIFRLIKAFSND